MSGRVLVVGSVNVDLVVPTERLPPPGETVLGGTFERFHGARAATRPSPRPGSAARSCSSARRRRRVRGRGPAGARQRARRRLAPVPIPEPRLGWRSSSWTPRPRTRSPSPRRQRRARRRAWSRRPSAASTRTRATSSWSATRSRPRTAREALRIGRKAGATTILNPAPADGMRPPCSSLADVVTPNRGELVAGGSILDEAGRSRRATDPVGVARRLLEALPSVARAPRSW